MASQSSQISGVALKLKGDSVAEDEEKLAMFKKRGRDCVGFAVVGSRKCVLLPDKRIRLTADGRPQHCIITKSTEDRGCRKIRSAEIVFQTATDPTEFKDLVEEYPSDRIPFGLSRRTGLFLARWK